MYSQGLKFINIPFQVTFRLVLCSAVGVSVLWYMYACMFLCVNGLAETKVQHLTAAKQLALFIANSTRLVDTAECD